MTRFFSRALRLEWYSSYIDSSTALKSNPHHLHGALRPDATSSSFSCSSSSSLARLCNCGAFLPCCMGRFVWNEPLRAEAEAGAFLFDVANVAFSLRFWERDVDGLATFLPFDREIGTPSSDTTSSANMSTSSSSSLSDAEYASSVPSPSSSCSSSSSSLSLSRSLSSSMFSSCLSSSSSSSCSSLFPELSSAHSSPLP